MRSEFMGWSTVGAVSVGGLVLFAGILFVGVSGRAEEIVPSVSTELNILTGVYSDEQRRRGAQVYLKQCSTCHGERLRGGESAPALVGSIFREHWIGHSVEDLLEKINLMPPKDPGRLTSDESASVIAVILASNGFPAGSADLPTTANVLQHILIASPKTP